MTSHFMMPPKMLTKIAFTLGLLRMIWKAFVTCSCVAPPPTSRKFAGAAAVVLDDVHRRHREAGAVDEAADVAVERHVGEARRASASSSTGSSSSASRSSPSSLWRNSALSSKLIFASSATTSPFLVTTSGLISSSEQSSVDEAARRARRCSLHELPRPCSFVSPRPSAERELARLEGARGRSTGSTCTVRIFSGVSCGDLLDVHRRPRSRP